MSQKVEYYPRAQAVQSSIESIPEIIHVSYDLFRLELTLRFSEITTGTIYFTDVIGFRLLDERNLLEFWDENARAKGWLWLIQSGGWFDLEKMRGGFIEALHEIENRKEYLVVGMNDCISILTLAEPICEYL